MASAGLRLKRHGPWADVAVFPATSRRTPRFRRALDPRCPHGFHQSPRRRRCIHASHALTRERPSAGPHVCLPPSELAAPFRGTALYAPAPGAPGDLPPPFREPLDRFRAATPPAVPAGTAAAEHGPLPWPPHHTLGRGDLECEPGRQAAVQAASHPGACPCAPHVHGAIGRVAYDPMPSPRELPLKPVAAPVGP
jgi:hypothetical protein